MAEFCLECWNKLNESEYTISDVKLSEGLEFCEGCYENKHVILNLNKIYLNICNPKYNEWHLTRIKQDINKKDKEKNQQKAITYAAIVWIILLLFLFSTHIYIQDSITVPIYIASVSAGLVYKIFEK